MIQTEGELYCKLARKRCVMGEGLTPHRSAARQSGTRKRASYSPNPTVINASEAHRWMEKVHALLTMRSVGLMCAGKCASGSLDTSDADTLAL